MTTRNLMTAFVLSAVVAWSQLGGVAHAQHEPVQADRAIESAPSHRHVQLDPQLHLVDSVPQSSRRAHLAGGIPLIVLGALGIVGSAVFAIIAEVEAHPICLRGLFSDGGSPSCPGHDATAWWAATGVSAGVGLISLISGIALVASRDPMNAAPSVRVAVAPTEGGAFGTVAVDF